jgi:hypothetical protein
MLLGEALVSAQGASAGRIPALIGALVVAYAVLANSLPLILGLWAS